MQQATTLNHYSSVYGTQNNFVFNKDNIVALVKKLRPSSSNQPSKNNSNITVFILLNFN